MAEAFKVAVIGSGPSGFYAAEALLRAPIDVEINLIDRLPTPFGLVRSGVAPDHPKLKAVSAVFERILKEENVFYFGNVCVGEDLSISELRATHDAVILACGAPYDRALSIPGEELTGFHKATEFVGWYNGHPDFRDLEFNLQNKVAVIIGNGNVAADVCRILAKPIEELRGTDIAEHALLSLANSKVEDIYIVGRRGPAQAKFTTKELKEIEAIEGVNILVERKDVDIRLECQSELDDPGNVSAKKNVEFFQSQSYEEKHGKGKVIRFCFFESPVQLHGEKCVEAIELSRNMLQGRAFSQRAVTVGETRIVPCGLVFSSIGYRSEPIVGLPYDDLGGTIPHLKGRVLPGNSAVCGLYVTGWQKRGPTGIIGTNRADSIETVTSVVTDIATKNGSSKRPRQNLGTILHERGVAFVSKEGWWRIDAAEIEAGRARGKPREKFTHISDMVERACNHDDGGNEGV